MTEFVKNVNSIDYGKVLEMRKTLNREITTVPEYIQWVREWRKLHESLVGSIQFLRVVKHEFRNGRRETESVETEVNRSQNSKLALRPFARELYELRTERKANFKAGVYGDPTYKPENSRAA